MSSDRLIFKDHYTHGRPYVRAKVVIVNPETGRQTTIKKDFWIDTGFEGGAHVAEAHVSEVNLIGVKPRLGTVGLAGGERRRGFFCLAYLQQIGDCELAAPGIEATLILQGSANHGLLGLEILKHFIAKFDGPNELLTIMSAHS